MAPGWLVALVFLSLLGGVGVLVVGALRDQGGHTSRQRGSENPSVDILRARYARGEIDRDEFEGKKRDLQRQ